MTECPNFSNFDIIARVDAWPYYQKDPDAYREHMKNYRYFLIKGFSRLFGYIHSSVVSTISWDKHWIIESEKQLVTFKGGSTFESRSKRMTATLLANSKKDSTSAFGPWANELFPIYDAGEEHILDLDGAGLDPFGIVHYSCHLIAYVTTNESLRYWVLRRAKTKLSFSDMLDNTVGKSLISGEKPMDCTVRECAEEALFPMECTRANIRSCGTLSYQTTQSDDRRSGCQRQVQYLYEIGVARAAVPVPYDGDVQESELMSLDQVVSAL